MVQPNGHSQIVFVDSGIENYQAIIKAIPAGMAVVILNGSQDGIVQITQALSNYQNLSAIHVISHGSSAALNLGNATLSAGNMDGYASNLQQWRSSLNEDADILLYGCDVASGPAGVSFLTQFSVLTDADVAASNDVTSATNGNLILEQAIGQMDTAPIDIAAAGWSGSLVTVLNANSNRLVFDTPMVMSGVNAGSINNANVEAAGKTDGGVIKFNNVITIGGQVIDAVVTTILSSTNTNDLQFTTYDSTSSPSGVTGFFQPLIKADSGQYVSFSFSFYTHTAGATYGSQVTLQNVVVNSYDIDAEQFQEFKGFASYSLGQGTALVVAPQSDGSVRFTDGSTNNGSMSDSGGVLTSADDAYRVKVNYDSITTFVLKTGVAGSGNSLSTAYYALDFSVGPSWNATPVTTGTVAKNLTYNANSMSEAVANDGSFTSSITITLNNDTFTGANGDNFILSSLATVSGLPAGLTAVVTRAGPTTATLTLTGNATAHANAQDTSLLISFANGAFAGNNASVVTGNGDYAIALNFADPVVTPALSYSGSTLSEAGANDGSISTTLTITLANDTFAGADGVISGTAKVTVSNVPAGLTAVVTKTSSTTATLTLTGTATAHANAQDINNLTVAFGNTAFTGGNAAGVTDSTKSNLQVDFADPASSGGGASSPSPTAVLSQKDAILNSSDTTKKLDPSLEIRTINKVEQKDKIKIRDSEGKEVGSSEMTDADAKETPNLATAKINKILDDGDYTFTVSVYDSNGNLKETAPAIVKVITDRDGVNPSIELTANKGDFNKDGISDWQQNNVAQLPLLSFSEYQKGSSASSKSFGAILAGNLSSRTGSDGVLLDADAQLENVIVTTAPAPMPVGVIAVTDMFNFTVKAQEGVELTDLDLSAPGLQTRVVIALPSGVQANDYMKFNPLTQTWYSFLDDQNLSTYDNGATLVDSNKDGLIDQVVVTLTDGGFGDEDGLVNGVIVDPGLLADSDSRDAVYSILLANGDRYLTTKLSEAARLASGTKNHFEGVAFDSNQTEGQLVSTYRHLYSKDWYYGFDGESLPISCYKKNSAVGFYASAVGQAEEDYYLFMNKKGLTQFLTLAQANDKKIEALGYANLGAKFSASNNNQYVFDQEAFLVLNKDELLVQNFVENLQKKYQSASNKGFVEAVEHFYLTEAILIGMPHGGTASVADLNAAFGTNFTV